MNGNYNMVKIIGVYFICCLRNYIEIVKEQLECLNKGLLDKTDKLIIFITNYNKEKCVELDDILINYSNKLILVKSEHNLFEKFAINNYKNYITETDYYLYYFHTKGLKDKNDPLFRVFSSRRKILDYYTLIQYDINIKLLEEYDAVGCSLHRYPKKHFSGNFWWSKSSYLQNLGKINDKYLSPEMYILSNNNCKFISLANDTNCIYIENFSYPSKELIYKNLTNNIIDNDEHKGLISLCE